MHLLRDVEIEQLLSAGQLATGFPVNLTTVVGAPIPLSGHVRSVVQPASIDIRIGHIYRPGKDEKGFPISGAPGGYKNDCSEYWLQSGETAVVTTKERIVMPEDHAGFGFPPSHLAINGLLMTNPGHIDPGFEGHLSFTVINMGREAFHLRENDPIMTLLVIGLGNAPQTPYRQLNGVSPPPGARPNAATLTRLARDFMNFRESATAIADERLRAQALRTDWFPALLATLAILTAGYFALFAPLSDVRSSVATLEERSQNEHTLKGELDALQRQVARLEQQLEQRSPSER